MDVVNETVEIDGNWFAEKPGNNLWENPWTQIGLNDDDIPIYIIEAFKMAMNMPQILNLYLTNMEVCNLKCGSVLNQQSYI